MGRVCRRKTTSCIAITNVESNDRSSLSKLVESVKTNYNERGEEIKRHWGGGSLGAVELVLIKTQKIYDIPPKTSLKNLPIIPYPKKVNFLTLASYNHRHVHVWINY